MAQWLKFAEIFIAALAVAGYARQSLTMLYAALAGFGVLAALFGPILVLGGSVPDGVPDDRVMRRDHWAPHHLTFPVAANRMGCQSQRRPFPAG